MLASIVGQPIVIVIVETQPRLQAAAVIGGDREGFSRQSQLVRIGQVFGVEDRQKLAARELQRIVERLGLGLRRAGGNDDHFHMVGKLCLGDEGAGCEIARLENELDVEPVARIIAALCSKRTKTR